LTDYYSLLRITPQASKLDIINAYRHAKLTYRRDSLAVYSLYSEDELALVRQEVEDAYAILSDRDKREAYDAEHGFAPAANAAARHGRDDHQDRVETGDDEGHDKGIDNVVHLHRRETRDYDPDLERRIQKATEFPGSLLREVREYRGISLQEVADQTRISIGYLQAIEDEDVAALPVRAYLKGYVGQYAAEISLEPHRVVHGYPPLTED